MKFLIGFVLTLWVILILTYFFQRSLIYFPSREKPNLQRFRILGMQEITLHTSDGVSLLSWYKPANNGQPTLLYFQGNAGDISMRAKIIQPYLRKGYGILLLGYRGYGGNPGKPSEQGLYKDADAAWRFLTNESIHSKCIILYGESLGSGIAIELAQQNQAGAVVLLAPYTSMTELGKYHYPFLPVRLLLKDHFDSHSKLFRVKLPILVFAAEKDNVIPLYLTKLFYAAANSNKKLVVYSGIGHDKLPAVVQQQVIDFLEKNVTCKN